MRFPSLASARRHLPASYAVAAPTTTGGRWGSFLASTAPAMRASLFAKATAATLLWTRVVENYGSFFLLASRWTTPLMAVTLCWARSRMRIGAVQAVP